MLFRYFNAIFAYMHAVSIIQDNETVVNYYYFQKLTFAGNVKKSVSSMVLNCS